MPPFRTSTSANVAGTGFSADFLSAAHGPGEWRRFLQTLNERAEVENESWLRGVLAGACHGLQLHIHAVNETFSNSKSSEDRRFANMGRSSLFAKASPGHRAARTQRAIFEL
jgi:hypothetical protein